MKLFILSLHTWILIHLILRRGGEAYRGSRSTRPAGRVRRLRSTEAHAAEDHDPAHDAFELIVQANVLRTFLALFFFNVTNRTCESVLK